MEEAGFVRSSSHKYARSSEKLQKQVELKRSVGHNQLLSLGCGAYGFINDTFYWNTKSLNEYRQSIDARRPPVWLGKRLDAIDLQCKAMVQGMHTNPGVPVAGFEAKFGVTPFETFPDEISRLCNLGLLEVAERHVRPTAMGRFFTDEISLCFYADSVKEKLASEGMRYGMLFEADKYV
jgi:oxygen-independent coproporphyrinogen III oxidase